MAGLGQLAVRAAMEITETAAGRRPAAAVISVGVTVGTTLRSAVRRRAVARTTILRTAILIGHPTPVGMIDIVKHLSRRGLRNSMIVFDGDHPDH
ncbi:MAG TPA: hypothetical protein VGQ11_10715, partial [Candidatus Acidoferrales bacterium]|nr:hypothetical protein [Candidatus Acidoferrales bacterium]